MAAHLTDCAGRVLEWLKELQRCCGQQVPLIKHDRFVRLCRQVADQTEPPQEVLALDFPTGAASSSPGSAAGRAATEAGGVTEHSANATSWGRRVQLSVSKLVQRRPRLGLIVVLAIVLPAAVWGTWHTLVDVNRAVSGVGVFVLALAAARPLLNNLAWATNILLGTPIRAGGWLAGTLEPNRPHQPTHP